MPGRNRKPRNHAVPLLQLALVKDRVKNDAVVGLMSFAGGNLSAFISSRYNRAACGGNCRLPWIAVSGGFVLCHDQGAALLDLNAAVADQFGQ